MSDTETTEYEEAERRIDRNKNTVEVPDGAIGVTLERKHFETVVRYLVPVETDSEDTNE